MEKRWHPLIWVLLGVIVVVMAGSALYRVVNTKQKDARLAAMPIPVQTVPATVRTVGGVIGASGIIVPSMPVNVTAKVEARVLLVKADVGKIVRRGAPLVQLDPSLFIANLNSAQVSLVNSENELDRQRTLAAENYAAAKDVETAEANVAAAEAALVKARIDLANTKITSPVDAVILTRNVNPGESTKLDETLLQLGVLDPVQLNAAVSEDQVGFVYIGMKADVGTDAFPGSTFHGTVVKIDSVVSDTTRSFGAYIELENHDLKLKKGVTGYARLHSSLMGLTVPSSAVINPSGDRATLFVVGDDDKAHLRSVLTGMSADGMTIIVSGLQEGERVVAVGQSNLHDNDLVQANRFAPWDRS
jgi:RND family efflux transporter MFP subunit